MSKSILIISMIFLSIMLSGCNNTFDSVSQFSKYKIIASEDFNESMCSGTGFGNSENGHNWGLRLIIKDKDTDEILNGSASYASSMGGGGLSVDGSYTCEKNISDGTIIMSVYAHGYAPLVFIMTPTDDSLTAIEVKMIKSCTSAPSCFDNFELQNSQLKIDNKTLYDERLKEFESYYYDYIDNNFGINRTDYVLQCMECNLDRGGYVKAKGTYKNGTDLELYYHWGWCSSGGSDCGYSKCISTNSEDFMNSKISVYCDKLSWNGRNDGHFCMDEEFNNDTIIRNDCMDGKFENKESGKFTFALSQTSNRCTSTVTGASFDCIGR